MVYVAIVGAILVLIGNNTKLKYSKQLIISGMIITFIGVVLIWYFQIRK
ncbi:MAG: hypothetical protein ACM3X9_02700 [Bacillota bacterium]